MKLKPMKKYAMTWKKACKNVSSEKNTRPTNLEDRSMRDNLIVYGIQEVPPTIDGQQVENCEQLVK